MYTVSLCESAPEDPFVTTLRGNPAFTIMKHLRCDRQCPPLFTNAKGARVSIEEIQNALDPDRPARIKAEFEAALGGLAPGTIKIYVTCKDTAAIHNFYSLPPGVQDKFDLVFLDPWVRMATPAIEHAPPEYTPEAMHLLVQGRSVKNKADMKARTLLASPALPLYEFVVVIPQDEDAVKRYGAVHPAWRERVVLDECTTALRMRTPAIIRKADSGVSVNMTLSVDEFFNLPDPASLPPLGTYVPGPPAPVKASSPPPPPVKALPPAPVKARNPGTPGPTSDGKASKVEKPTAPTPVPVPVPVPGPVLVLVPATVTVPGPIPKPALKRKRKAVLDDLPIFS